MQTPNYNVMVKDINLGQVQVLNMITQYDMNRSDRHIFIWIIKIDLTLIVISETKLIDRMYIKL